MTVLLVISATASDTAVAVDCASAGRLRFGNVQRDGVCFRIKVHACGKQKRHVRWRHTMHKAPSIAHQQNLPRAGVHVDEKG